MKRELSKLDCILIGIFIGLIATCIIFSAYQIEEQNSCHITGNHNYITRCSECGDVLTEEELAEKYCNQ